MLIDVRFYGGHRISLARTHSNRWGELVRPQCRCGWRGPGYSLNDEATARSGGVAHVVNASDPNHREYKSVESYGYTVRTARFLVDLDWWQSRFGSN